MVCSSCGATFEKSAVVDGCCPFCGIMLPVTDKAEQKQREKATAEKRRRANDTLYEDEYIKEKHKEWKEAMSALDYAKAQEVANDITDYKLWTDAEFCKMMNKDTDFYQIYDFLTAEHWDGKLGDQCRQVKEMLVGAKNGTHWNESAIKAVFQNTGVVDVQKTLRAITRVVGITNMMSINNAAMKYNLLRHCDKCGYVFKIGEETCPACNGKNAKWYMTNKGKDRITYILAFIFCVILFAVGFGVFKLIGFIF